MTSRFRLLHHGAVDGVTGSCHELRVAGGAGILIDCGLFQGAETSPEGAGSARLEINFPIEHVKALVVTHVHIDHVGRVPYLLAAGFSGPIFCTEPSARLLPLVLEDALRVGATRDRDLVERCMSALRKQVVPCGYSKWLDLGVYGLSGTVLRFEPAGHILGSAYVRFRLAKPDATEIVFSGDLGAPHAPLLSAPKSPYRADVLVLESTYGDRVHVGRKERRATLQRVLEHALRDGGTVMIPAFSIGRTQELLYELEDIIHRAQERTVAPKLPWKELDIVVDSPLASRFTSVYQELKPYWDKEARGRVSRGRHPLSFEQLTTVNQHEDHIKLVELLARTGRPAVVLAAGGMCSGGRIVNYLKAMLSDPRHDVLFVGYQAAGTLGRDIQTYGPRGGYVHIDEQRIEIRARIDTISGYSAHAGQDNLVNFVRRMRHRPRQIRLVHGEPGAKQALKEKLLALGIAEVGVVGPDIPPV